MFARDRQDFRHGVPKATFSAIDSFAWERLMRWIRAKYAGRTELSMKELRRRFCDQGWRFAHNEAAFTGASNVAVTRYRYRGSTIATPWTPTGSSQQLTNGQDTWSARCADEQSRQCAPVRPNPCCAVKRRCVRWWSCRWWVSTGGVSALQRGSLTPT